MEGGDAGQPADGHNGADPFLQEDQVTRPAGLVLDFRGDGLGSGRCSFAEGHHCRRQPQPSVLLEHVHIAPGEPYSSAGLLQCWSLCSSSHHLSRCCAGHPVRGGVAHHAACRGARPPGRLRRAAALCRRPASCRRLNRRRTGQAALGVLLRWSALLACSQIAPPLPSFSASNCTLCMSSVVYIDWHTCHKEADDAVQILTDVQRGERSAIQPCIVDSAWRCQCCAGGPRAQAVGVRGAGGGAPRAVPAAAGRPGAVHGGPLQCAAQLCQPQGVCKNHTCWKSSTHSDETTC